MIITTEAQLYAAYLGRFLGVTDCASWRDDKYIVARMKTMKEEFEHDRQIFLDTGSVFV